VCAAPRFELVKAPLELVDRPRQRRYPMTVLTRDQIVRGKPVSDLPLGKRVDHLGCSCPTAKNPDVMRCHTVLALRFMRAHYPALDIRYPG
jgi:hypothetical protein